MTTGERLKKESTPRPPVPPIKRDLFTRAAGWTIRATGGRWAFLTALAVVIIWALTGPFFHYSEIWQLVINTGTTIVTFLMVFLIQNAQNRESKAIHLKLDELILCARSARNEMIDIEDLTEAQLEALAERYRKVAEKYHHNLTECFEAVEEARALSPQAVGPSQPLARPQGSGPAEEEREPRGGRVPTGAR
jgi:low affinity Fe/Cu permease